MQAEMPPLAAQEVSNSTISEKFQSSPLEVFERRLDVELGGIKITDDTKLSGEVDIPDGCDAILRDVDKLKMHAVPLL
ncbi:hypothetical protein DUI87_08434 [Hirundo rustica rustica]|uniref:Uncharacterized protein n=1 Tax=Hirundo rustica rustica TaxID=333673 RepID=A0A3M0KSE6_HIRRU|nr:hypothetical protein DUI87_08434 [Hirundo rustica rustica]